MADIIDELRRDGADAPHRRYVLRLYVTGTTPQSSRAIANLKAICEGRLQGRYHLEIVDLYQQPELARGQQIVAAPTLVKELPPPLRRLVGDLSNTQRVLLTLDLEDIAHPAAMPRAPVQPHD